MEDFVNIIQFNPTVGDVAGNTDEIIDRLEENSLNVTSEMALVGYPPQDILHREELYSEQKKAIDRVSADVDEGVIVLGAPTRKNGFLYNSALVVDKDGVKDVYSKNLLPTYDVFNEARYFRSDRNNLVFNYKGRSIGITICEDAWSDVTPDGVRQHDDDPILDYAEEDIDLMLNLSASPYRYEKPRSRVERFRSHSETIDAPVVFANQLGANDELIFDGGSFVVDSTGIIDSLKSFRRDNTVIPEGNTKELVDAVRLGISDYFDKTGFEKAVIGMSGGIDSSVAVTLASDALGSENVTGISLPSEVSSKASVTDAEKVANRLGIDFEVISIEDAFDISEADLSSSGYDTSGITSENLQARLRGVYLMAVSNSMNNSLVITPDNKSESAVGYCTLYGDTVGAVAPLGDLYKNKVYDIADFYNSSDRIVSGTVIHENVMKKDPTAELKQDQSDSDDIPEYSSLDQFLRQYVDDGQSIGSIETDLTSDEASEIVSRIHRSEFKRNQSPIILRVSEKDMSTGWRYPIAADYDFLR